MRVLAGLGCRVQGSPKSRGFRAAERRKQTWCRSPSRCRTHTLRQFWQLSVNIPQCVVNFWHTLPQHAPPLHVPTVKIDCRRTCERKARVATWGPPQVISVTVPPHLPAVPAAPTGSRVSGLGLGVDLPVRYRIMSRMNLSSGFRVSGLGVRVESLE